jgi:hypothetical protein
MCAQIVSLITGFLTLAFRKLAAGNDTIRLQTTPLRWSSNINSIPFNQYAVLVHIVCSAAAPFFYFIHFQTQWRAFQVLLDFLPKFVLVWLFLDNKNINHLCSDENSRTLRNYRKGSQFQNSWKYRLQTVFRFSNEMKRCRCKEKMELISCKGKKINPLKELAIIPCKR